MKTLQSAQLLWRDLNVSPKELHLDTLRCGQSFRWHRASDYWSCVLKGQLCVLRQTPATVEFGVVDVGQENRIRALLRDYFQIDRVSLEACYERWSSLDKNFAKRSKAFEGIRILRQDPWENLVSFICSSNNNIARISQMVQKLCVHYGPPVATLDGVVHHDFPSLTQLAGDGVESKLRNLGFGYRAKYIAKTAKLILEEHPEMQEQWLFQLREIPYAEAKEALIRMPGVGPKVADCVCLMSLDHPEAIPVDTHVWQIAQRDYGFSKKLKTKTLSAKFYDQVGDHFRDLFGEYSGWAHSVLFTADLRSFKDAAKEVANVVAVEDQKIEVKMEQVEEPSEPRKRRKTVIKKETFVEEVQA
ncbi:DNA glycosylase [Syncephalastrum racemosum]|uniref:N-glycosylase/DNA lyase n=1 Tax=Syncephalastrum racemosum TaxID=13706 RepID=A0A1X2H651_SYNRA|nr:DNA glycosylase [Syncephalastrum racemosum]